MYAIHVVRFTESLLPGYCSSCPSIPTGEWTFAQTRRDRVWGWTSKPATHVGPGAAPKWSLSFLPQPWSLLLLPSVRPLPIWIRSHQASPSGPHAPRTSLTTSLTQVHCAHSVLLSAMAPLPAPALSQQTSLTKHKIKIKWTLSRWWEQNMQPNVGHFSAEGLTWLHRSHTRQAGPEPKEEGRIRDDYELGYLMSGVAVNRTQPLKN